MTFDNNSSRPKDRVLCKDGRVFHACEVCRKKRSRCDGARPQCTACRTRGLPCEYRAMRKRGRHGKKEPLGVLRSPQQHHLSLPMTTSTSAMAAAAAAAAAAAVSSSTTDTLNLLNFPRFFSLPTDIPMHAVSNGGGRGAMDPVISSIASAPQQQQQHQHHPPDSAPLPHQLNIGTPSSMFLGSPSPVAPGVHTQMSSPLLAQPLPPPPIAFRSMSTTSNSHLFDSPPGTLSMVAAAMNAAAAAATIQPISLGHHQQQQHQQQFPQQHQHQHQQPVVSPVHRSPSTAAMAAAVAAFHFSPSATPAVGPHHMPPQMSQMSSMASITIPHTGTTAVDEDSEGEEEEDDDELDDDDDANQHQQMDVETPSAEQRQTDQRTKDWRRAVLEEEQVLDGLDTDGADSFGRPLFDIHSYPLPSVSELDEQTNGMFEYFYMGVQTLHEATFRRRLRSGSVSPILIYAIMAVGSRYSRKPSLHSINGMAFLNGDRHASTACGLASIQLNHGDLGSVDTVHGMLFLSVYFMGQGNMLKSRMYLVKAVCTARTMGFQNMDATFIPSSPMIAFRGNFDRPTHQKGRSTMCSCPQSVDELVELETKRRIWWFLVFVDYFTANVMNMPVEIAPDSYCVRLPCSDEEWMSPTLNVHEALSPLLANGSTAVRDLGFGDRLASAQQGAEYQRLNGFHDCRPPWLYRPGAFYLERLMIEFCDHLRRFNSLRSLAMRSFFYAEPTFVDEGYPYLRKRRQFVSWSERLEKVKSSWSWLHLQLNKWLDSILLRFSEVINRVPSDQYNRQYRHQYYYYLIAAHSTIIMSHGVVLQLYSDFSRYIKYQQDTEEAEHQQFAGHQSSTTTSQTPPVDYGSLNGLSLSEGLSEFAIGGYGSAMAPLMQMAQGLTGTGSSGSSSSARGGSSIYGSVIGSPISNGNGPISFDDPNGTEMSEMARLGIHLSGAPPQPTSSVLSGPQAAINIQRDLFEMATIAWDGCVSTAEQLASILRGKHPKFVLLGGPPIEVFHEQVRSGDANILSQPGSTFNAPGSGPGADNPILSDPDFYMRLQPSTAWWMFLVAQVQVGHIKRLLKESEGSFKVSARRKALATRAARAKSRDDTGMPDTQNAQEDPHSLLGITGRPQKPADQMRPLSSSVNNSAVMLATAVHLSSSAPAPPNRQALEKRAAIKVRASRLVRAYENLSCMVKVLEGMQQYWQCMDYISVIQDILKGSEHPLH
ncbi:hypothetical protein LPJ74_003555 [Coemansia sp. RSA 1843]|nr:hypothetical protein LPJ74_003555 [Coemansia sp. RSA 1843]